MAWTHEETRRAGEKGTSQHALPEIGRRAGWTQRGRETADANLGTLEVWGCSGVGHINSITLEASHGPGAGHTLLGISGHVCEALRASGSRMARVCATLTMGTVKRDQEPSVQEP